MVGRRDPSTLSNYETWCTRHTTVHLHVDFALRRLRGSVVLDFEAQTDAARHDSHDEIILDTSYLDVSSVKILTRSGQDAGKLNVEAKWEVKPRRGFMGSPMHIALGGREGRKKGDRVRMSIEVATTGECTALQWLEPAQTSNKKAPFVFSQCQAIHARSLFPCQDTPDVKSTYDFNIASPYTVVASGVAVRDEEEDGSEQGFGQEKLHRFRQAVPIPSYLFALASGDLAMAPIGKRSIVATSPSELEASREELCHDMDKFMQAAEDIVFPYPWREYNVLVLPPSFPYGGMENPVFTFATPTIISGDRQNVDVIAHELAHSWSGNLVTSCSWEHFWLNEGWTVYLERRIQAAVHRSEALFHFSTIIGWKHLENAVDELGKDHAFTRLRIRHEDVDPDDAFSTIPYEKGFHLIWSLDRLVGRENFDRFIPHYFKTWQARSLDSDEFKATFLRFFGTPEYAHLRDKVETGIDWDGRFFDTGLPPKPDLDTSMVDVCYDLADEWEMESSDAFKPSASDMDGWTGNQKLVFLNKVLDFEKPLTAEQSQLLGRTYGVASCQNVELKAVYQQIAMRALDTSAYQDVAELLGQVGRMKFVRPLYRGLEKVDRELAVRTFEKNRDFYHPICKQMVEKDLKLV